MTDYRTASAPTTTERVLEVRPPGERAMLVVAGLLLVGLTPFVFENGFHPQAWIPSLLLAAFARYGRTTVFVEHRPRSGELTLVTRRLFGKHRESFAADAIEAVELQRIESKGLVLAEMYDVVFRFADGSLAHVFGRPLGLEPARAHAVVRALERIVDDARTGMLRIRVAEPSPSPSPEVPSPSPEVEGPEVEGPEVEGAEVEGADTKRERETTEP